MNGHICAFVRAQYVEYIGRFHVARLCCLICRTCAAIVARYVSQLHTTDVRMPVMSHDLMVRTGASHVPAGVTHNHDMAIIVYHPHAHGGRACARTNVIHDRGESILTQHGYVSYRWFLRTTTRFSHTYVDVRCRRELPRHRRLHPRTDAGEQQMLSALMCGDINLRGDKTTPSRSGIQQSWLYAMQLFVNAYNVCKVSQTKRPRGVTVSTLDSESSDRGSNPREAWRRHVTR